MRQHFDPERRSREARRVETAIGLFQVISPGAPKNERAPLWGPFVFGVCWMKMRTPVRSEEGAARRQAEPNSKLTGKRNIDGIRALDALPVEHSHEFGIRIRIEIGIVQKL